MLIILGIVAIIVFTVQVYKTALGTGRSPAAWAAITAVIGVGIQFILPVLIGVAIGIYLMMTGGAADSIGEDYFGLLTLIGVAGIGLSIAGMWLVMKHVSKVVDDGTSAFNPPPPPPPF